MKYFHAHANTVQSHVTVTQSCDSHVGTDSGSSSSQHLHTLHLQHNIQGAASNKKGEATSNNTPNPAKMPTTCVLCHITEALECPSLFLHGPLS